MTIIFGSVEELYYLLVTAYLKYGFKQQGDRDDYRDYLNYIKKLYQELTENLPLFRLRHYNGLKSWLEEVNTFTETTTNFFNSHPDCIQTTSETIINGICRHPRRGSNGRTILEIVIGELEAVGRLDSVFVNILSEPIDENKVIYMGKIKKV
jgi:hypothetical protein